MQQSHAKGGSSVCIATLLYYQVLGNIPLTTVEVWWYQMNSEQQPTTLSLRAIQRHLHNLVAQGDLREENGFFALKNAPSCYAYRAQCVVESIHKWFIIQKIGKFLPYIPFIRHIRVLGSVATGSATYKSDLDISIGTATNSMWSVRFFTTLFSQFLGVRRHSNTTQDRLCFNHYTSKANAPYGTPNPLFWHIEKQSIVLWSATKNAVLTPRNIGLVVKKLVEKTLRALRIAQAVETGCSVFQIKKIQNNPTPYPSQLPRLTRNSLHLVFYYPKIQETQKHLNAHKLSTNNT